MRTEFAQTVAETSASSIGSRGIAKQSGRSSGEFAGTLAAAASRLTVPASVTPSGGADAVTQYLRTGVSPDAAKTGTRSDSQQTAQPPTNPFAAAAADYPVVNVGGSGMEVYFKTHAPGEWWQRPAARAAFAELYGEAALVTLDYTGTVPENMDPTWVTKVPVDASGKPLPKHSAHKELT